MISGKISFTLFPQPHQVTDAKPDILNACRGAG
jgi:hypothetical protein